MTCHSWLITTGLSMQKHKCPVCGLVNWHLAGSCKRCSQLGYDSFATNRRASVPIVRDDGLAWASLMLGLGGFLLLGLSSAIGLVIGIIAFRRAGRQPLHYGGRNYALAGILLSCLSLAMMGGLAWTMADRWLPERSALENVTGKITAR